MFVTGMNENDAGIYGIRFFIRGKPWIVTIDNKMPFRYSVFNGYSLRGVKQGNGAGAMWPPILEKAWAKIKGGYSRSGMGGFSQNGLRALVGSPIFSYTINKIGSGETQSLYNADAVFEEI